MASRIHHLCNVVAQFPSDCQPSGNEDLQSAGGFSGANLWRLTTPRGTLLVRRWPVEYPDPARLAWMHAVLRNAWEAGFQRLPLPIASRQGKSFVQHDGHLWELTPWLPGAADYLPQRRPIKLAAALRALAEFHRATEAFEASSRPMRSVPPPAIQRRLDQFAELSSGRLSRIIATLDRDEVDWPELRQRGQRHLSVVAAKSQHAEQLLRDLANRMFPLQPCIRDIWHDHVLFLGDEVSGLIDFGSLQIDTPATDIARLLGSLAGDDRDAWSRGLAAYQSLRPLSADEIQLIAALDRSSVLLAGVNWLQWIFLDHRQFRDRAAVLARFDAILARTWS